MLPTSGQNRQSYSTLDSGTEYDVQGFDEHTTCCESTVNKLNFATKKVGKALLDGYTSTFVPFFSGALTGALANTEYYPVSIVCGGIALSSIALSYRYNERAVFLMSLVSSIISTGMGLLGSFHEELGFVPGDRDGIPYYSPSPPFTP